jgi:hypothetical protein
MYEAHKWKIGEEITSDKLNHIEKGIEEAGLPREITDPQDGQTLKYDAASGKWVNGEGGGSGPLVVTATEGLDGTTMDHTWQEIHDAFPNVELVVDNGSYTEKRFIISVRDGKSYRVEVLGVTVDGTNITTYEADSQTGYPTTNSDEPMG